MSLVIRISDLRDPKTGKTYREINAEKKHKIPVGALVEMENGVRLFVMEHVRDCDETPLYLLGIDKQFPPCISGVPEESLKIIKNRG